MMFILIAIGFILNTNLFLNLTLGYEWKPVNTKSFLTIINCCLITIICYSYLHNYILINTIQNYLYYLIGFFLFDIIYLYKFETRKELCIKTLHHSIAFIGVLIFGNVSIIGSHLFLTEIINIPLEVRFIAIRNNYKKKAIKPIMEVLVYFLFLIYRIIYPFKHYISICKNSPFYYCINFTLLYILWIYWFILINIKVYNILDKLGLFNFKIDY